MTLPAAAARVPAVIDRSIDGRYAEPTASIDICCTRPISAANQPNVAAAVDRRDRQADGRTDGRTPDCYVDPAPRTMRAASVMYYWFAGWGPAQATIRNGARWGTYNAFLKRTLSRESVHIITHAVVQKVVYADKLSALEYSRW